MKIELSGHYTYGRILKSIIPSILMMIVSSLYSIVDGLFVSNFTSSTAFAALNLIWPAIMICGALGLMVGAGGSALVSKTLGEGDKQRAREIFSMLIKFSLVMGIVLAIAFFFLAKPISILLGAEGEMIPNAVVYGKVLGLGLPVFILQMVFQALFMTAEKPQIGTYLTLACGITNILLDALLILVFGWGIVGAAVATVISQAVGGLFPLWYFSSRHNSSKLQIVRCKMEKKPLLKSCSNGSSEYVGSIALSILSVFYNLQLMKYIGEDGVSAYGIIMYAGFVFAAVIIGYNIAVSPIIAFNYGKKDYAELSSLLRKSLVIMFATGILLTIIAEVTTEIITGIFVGYDKQLQALSIHAMQIYMLSFVFVGINMFASAWFTALNNGFVSAVSAFVRSLIFELGAVMLLPLVMGIDGIWFSVVLAEILAFVFSLILFYAYRKRYNYCLLKNTSKSDCDS